MYIQPGNERLPMVHNELAVVSNETKKASLVLQQITQEFQRRKANLVTIAQDQQLLKASLWKRNVIFKVIIAIYVIATWSLMVLVYFGLYNFMYALAGTIAVVVFLWWIIRILRKKNV
jgi:hypothetical protein